MSQHAFKIGDKTIGLKQSIYVIAEIGMNHNGVFDRAIQMIDAVKEIGADCAKFQMRNMASVYRKKSLKRSGEDLSTEYTLDLLDKFELTFEQHQQLAKYCDQIGITYMCTPWDRDSLACLEKIGAPAYKVASADMINLPLVGEIIKTKKPIIVSTGMSTVEEIQKTTDYLIKHGATFALLHCNSTYPAPFPNINLKFMDKLSSIHPIFGYSGHERGTSVSIAAVALGAQIIERHFTLDRNMEGPDHAASLELADFAHMMTGIREVEQALGVGGQVRSVSQGEMMNRENLAKSLVASRTLKKGQVITSGDVWVKSPGKGLSPQKLDELLGKTLTRDMEEEDFFYPTDLTGQVAQARKYNYRRPWGIPVRYHDFLGFNDSLGAPLYEFHLSYVDMDLKLGNYLNGTYDCEFVVHAPELFEGSHLMDLATPDESYRRRSLQETQRVIDITRNLKKYFPKTPKPLIVANVGGITRDGQLTAAQKNEAYEIFARSLRELDMEGVEIIPQTMAPFPWHFGGQRYQNLFVFADEIASYCRNLGLRICLDVSHSKLVANYHKLDFTQFVQTVAPYVAHLHMGDAAGNDGEGLQVGEGDIDFAAICDVLNKLAPQASFIPEIWQGHKNGGEGFWIALERLEKYF